jgi:hypothetical protein
MAKVLIATVKPFSAEAVEEVKGVLKDAGMILKYWPNIPSSRTCWLQYPMWTP